MKKVVGIRFYPWDKIYDFDPRNVQFEIHDSVIVDTELGVELGKVVYIGKEVDERKISVPLKPVLRKATTSDLEKIKKYKVKRDNATYICRELIEKYKLPMKLIDVHFSFDGSRVVFFFTSESRVDFRNLVKDLTREFQKSVRMQQIGARDEARWLGGYGLCGRELCCVKFLKKFKSISTDIARFQQMQHRGSERISGACGRLLCCLAYEQEQYEELAKDMPRVGDRIKTKQGNGRVIKRDILSRTLKVRLEDKSKMEIEVLLGDIK